MVCSTAARSGMRVIGSSSFNTSLQFMCCQALRKLVPSHLDVVDALEPFPPGLRAFLANNLGWLLRPTQELFAQQEKPSTSTGPNMSRLTPSNCDKFVNETSEKLDMDSIARVMSATRQRTQCFSGRSGTKRPAELDESGSDSDKRKRHLSQ